MERIIYILLIVLCCSCGARKKTAHAEREYRRDVELLESRIEQLVEESVRKVVVASKTNSVRIEYSAPDSAGTQHVIAETKTDTEVNLTSDEATKVEGEKKDSLSLAISEEEKEEETGTDDREGTTVVRDLTWLAWSVVILLASIVLFYLAFKFRKQIVSLLKRLIS